MNKKYTHLTEEDRRSIRTGLDKGDSFKRIARTVGKDCTTISKEVKNRRAFKKTGCYGQDFNNCANRIGCTVSGICNNPTCRKKCCRTCRKVKCYCLCPDYKAEYCGRLIKAPFVCNHCEKKSRCTLEKAVYEPTTAQREYKHLLSDSRSGVAIDGDEAARLDAIVSPLLLKGQSLHHICANNSDRIMHSERAMYNYVGASLFSARNIDMPRTVRFRVRRKKSAFKVDRACYVGRTYADFHIFCETHLGIGVVEMDTVYGRIGGKCLLTLHFVDVHYMLMLLLDSLTAKDVADAVASLRQTLGIECFAKLFPVLLTDRGSEFSDPRSIEVDDDGELLSNVFYCDPGQSQQKGAAENNHSLIRRILPKGKSFDRLEQCDITKVMNNVNSYGRPSLNDRSPYELFKLVFGNDVLKKVGAELVPADNIILHPSLLRK